MSEQEPERVTVPPVDTEPEPEQPAEEQPEPEPEAPAEAEPEAAPAPDEPTTVTVHDQMAAVTEESIAGDAPAHPTVLVRLADVLAHLENFLARHPELEAAAGADLRSGVSALERVNDPAAAQAARDAVQG